MSTFINFKDNQVEITSYRKPNHYACDLDELLQAIANCSNESLTCCIDNLKKNGIKKERSFKQRLQFRIVAPQYQKAAKFWSIK